MQFFSLLSYLAAIIPSDNCKIRFVAGLLMLSGTYVIGDMYSASLTSILARPPKGNKLFVFTDVLSKF